MTECFSEVDGRNSTELEVRVVKAYVQDKFVLEFENLPHFCIMAAYGLINIVLPGTFNREPETEKS